MDFRDSADLRSFVAEHPLRRGAILEVVRSLARALPGGSRVLDAGSGQAPYREVFSNHVYKSHDWAMSVHGAQPDVVGDLQEGLNLPPESFDAILCTEVLEHVLSPDRAIVEMRRLLRPGGSLVITVPFVVPLHEEPYDFWRPTPYALQTILEDSGFASVEVLPISGWFATLWDTGGDLGWTITGAEAAKRGFARRVLVRAVEFFFRKTWKLAKTLDRLDTRRALPLGWSVTATAV